MNTLRLVVAGAMSMVALGICKVAAWLADVPAINPTVNALVELRTIVHELPSIHLDGQPHDVALIPRAGVLAAIGQALTEAES